MLNKIIKVGLVFVIGMGLIFGQRVTIYAADQKDITTIKERLKEYFLGLDTIDDGAKVETCFVSEAEEYLALIQADGSFADVDYQAHNNAANGAAWSPYLALDRLQAIAIAYHREGNPLYQKKEAYQGVERALQHWVTQGSRNGQPDGPYSTNWWENQVGVQLRFSRIGLFMEGLISEDSLQIITEKLLEKKPVKYGTGQNNLWFNQNYIYYALITNDEELLKSMVDDYLNYCLSIQEDDKTAEAVQVDNSFYMHGKQFYSNGYGMTMFRDMSFWIYMLRETPFAISSDVVDRMGNYMLNGTSWTIRGDIQELYLGYRPYKYEVGYQNYAQEYIEPLKRMIVSDRKRASEYQQVLENIEGKNKSNGKDGNYYMWRSGYASHMRPNYGVNIKMDSKNLKGGEWRGPWNQAGKPNQQLIYWTSAASSTVTVDGDEYTSVYPVFDWTHTPGATAPHYISGTFDFQNNALFNIGVSNGRYGATAYQFDKLSTKGQKGYFFFDDEFVALGSNISSTNGTAIHTTLNQSKANNVKVDGESVALGTVGKEYSAKMVYNNKVGYVFLDETKVKVSHDNQKGVPSLWTQEKKDQADAVFTTYIDHGVKPENASYAYIVVPNKTEAEVLNYTKSNTVKVVANNENVQAVRHDGLKQTQVHFYQAGKLEYKPGYTISVDKPCSVMIDESTSTRKITVAVNDHEEHQSVNVQLSYGQTQTKTVFVSKALPYAGQSLTLTEGQDNRYNASSSTGSHLPSYVRDGKKETYWESETANNEWISVYTDTDAYIADIDILWGSAYANAYDVYISQNGVDYEKIKEVTNGKGNEETIKIGRICRYIKVVMKSGNGSHFQMREMTLNQAELISYQKPTETSSVSSNAPTFVGSLAVDGDLSTRWASKRGSDNEWITIDLENPAKLNAIEINWENACSDNYAIQVSSDNQTWTTIKEHKTDADLSDVIHFDNDVTARYVRIHSYKSRLVNGTNYGINIFEIKIYGQAEAQEVEVNRALNKPSQASSVYVNPKSQFALESKYAFDGSVENRGDAFQSRWVSERRKENPGVNVDSQYIYVDLEEPYAVSKIVLNWEGACAKQYKIQVSDDAIQWTDVSHIVDGTAGIKLFSYETSVHARYVKVQTIEPSGSYGYSLWEFEVYGESLKDELKESYDQYKNIDTNNYTPESVLRYEEALDHVFQIYLNNNATSADITKAQQLLLDAVDQLVEKANKDQLQIVIDQAEVLNKDLYTDESLLNVMMALVQAKTINQDDNASQDHVDQAIVALQQALDALEEMTIKTIYSADKQTSVTGLLPKDVTLVAPIVQDMEWISKVQNINPDFFAHAKIEKIHDITLLYRESIYQPRGQMKVTMTIDEKMRDQEVGIVYINEEGVVTSISSVRDESTISFETNHFSQYAIVSYMNENRDDEEVTITPDQPPKTNDSTDLFQPFLVMGVLTIGYAILRKKKKSL